jgi:hypothetical protein
MGCVLTTAIADHAADIRECRLPNSCAIALAVPDKSHWLAAEAADAVPAAAETPTDIGNGKKRLSAADNKMFGIVGTEELKTLTNQEIAKRHRKQFLDGLGEMTDEAIRSRLNRIRRYFELPPSAEVRKKPVNS